MKLILILFGLAILQEPFFHLDRDIVGAIGWLLAQPRNFHPFIQIIIGIVLAVIGLALMDWDKIIRWWDEY